jgi:hypothetical protein
MARTFSSTTASRSNGIGCSPSHGPRAAVESMSRKSGNRFCEKGHAQTTSWSGMTIRRKVIPL